MTDAERASELKRLAEASVALLLGALGVRTMIDMINEAPSGTMHKSRDLLIEMAHVAQSEMRALHYRTGPS